MTECGSRDLHFWSPQRHLMVHRSQRSQNLFNVCVWYHVTCEWQTRDNKDGEQIVMWMYWPSAEAVCLSVYCDRLAVVQLDVRCWRTTRCLVFVPLPLVERLVHTDEYSTDEYLCRCRQIL